MTTTDRVTLSHVPSRDGTAIGVWTSGDGPPLVLVHGTTTEAAALPDARVVVLPEQQHIVHRLAPEAFARHVLRFLG